MKTTLKDFDIIVISLAARQDRRATISAALKREGLTYTFFDAVPAPKEQPKGWSKSLALYGCRESHILVLENATRPVLVFEDDADIPIGFAKKLEKLLLELNEQGMTLALSSHDMPFIKKIMDMVYFMDNGSIVEIWDKQQGTPPSETKIHQFLWH